ncbi:ATP synthase subunit I [Geomesophilobacter sediminis]|uniref:ATP synthase subunit I n=1 Tax=Geomesophilobacter sediminis TaxID=2798584 RepID=A0A8J7M0M9_9BACT|nr:ATP synthase subunit I [Geomesophilobacter sediminis]MBJ6726027.1 ATP synthase subunit I [Geomesophilobacter sediminis]
MAGTTRINEDNIYGRLLQWSGWMTLGLAVLGLLIFSVRFGLSVLAGGILATANFYRMRQGLEAILNIQPANPSRYAFLKYLGRIAVMAILLYVLIVYLKADLFGLLLGLSVLVINVILFSIFLSTRKGG